MPKYKLLQSSGAKKRRTAKERAAKDRVSVEIAPKLDRCIVHSKVHDDAPQNKDGNCSHNETEQVSFF